MPKRHDNTAAWKKATSAKMREMFRKRRLAEAQVLKSDAELISDALDRGLRRVIPRGASGFDLPKLSFHEVPKVPKANGHDASKKNGKGSGKANGHDASKRTVKRKGEQGPKGLLVQS